MKSQNFDQKFASGFDITIIGGSFSGMAAALALADISDNLKIAVIEKQDILNHDRKRDGRAYAISAESIKFFQKIQIFDEVMQNAGEISDIKITDHKSPFFLDFLGSQSSEEEGGFGQVIESYHVHNALRNQLVKRRNVTIFSPNSYKEINFFDQGASVQIDDGRVLESKLLLACDGRFSHLREIYQMHTTIKKYHQIAIVFNISHSRSHENIAYEKFLPGGPLAILPMKNKNESSIVWIFPDQDAKAMLDLDKENFLQQLNKKMDNAAVDGFVGGFLGEVDIISEKFSYPLALVEAENFYHEKMLLVGDAAVGVHPIAGQGFNLGIKGIKILAKLLQEALENGQEINSNELIKSYNKKTKFEAKKMIIATDILNSLFETKSFCVGVARDIGLGIVNKIPRLKNIFISNAGGKE